MASNSEALDGNVTIWDLPVRLIHWALVGLLPALWWTANDGKMTLHITLGLVMLGLVLFRLAWGCVGSSTARFGQFLAGPKKILAYLRANKASGQGEPLGHNPLGGWSVLALLALLLTQVSLGLVAQDVDAVSSGPLNHLVSWDVAVWASKTHAIIFNLLLAFVALHLAAIAFYVLVRRQSLIMPMVTGRKRIAAHVAAPSMASLSRAAAVAFLAALLAIWISWGLPPWGAFFPWDQPPALDGALSDDSYM